MTDVSVGTADLLDPAWWADIDGMHEFFRWARREAPVWRDEANGLWAVTRHADVVEVERRSSAITSGSKPSSTRSSSAELSGSIHSAMPLTHSSSSPRSTSLP